MQESSIRLFSRAYSVRSKIERVLLLLALLSVVLHGWLLYQLIAVRDFHSAMTFLYLFSLLPFSLFLTSVWLDRNPGYQRHLTLLAAGVRYRLGFLQREHEFDWEEVALIEVNDRLVGFELKNGERHQISLGSIDKKVALQQVKTRLAGIAAEKEIEFRLLK
jgi:hypothetical protein